MLKTLREKFSTILINLWNFITFNKTEVTGNHEVLGDDLVDLPKTEKEIEIEKQQGPKMVEIPLNDEEEKSLWENFSATIRGLFAVKPKEYKSEEIQQAVKDLTNSDKVSPKDNISTSNQKEADSAVNIHVNNQTAKSRKPIPSFEVITEEEYEKIKATLDNPTSKLEDPIVQKTNKTALVVC